jgi:hypothetical protein
MRHHLKRRRIVATLLPAGVAVAPTVPARAATNDVRGVDDQRDNFVDDTLVLGTPSTSDSYATTQAEANGIH